MYPGGNNYNQNNPNQQPGYNAQPPSYGAAPGYVAGGQPPLGFNVGAGMNQSPCYNPSYGAPQPGSYDSYNQYPSNPQPYMPPSQGYAPPPQSYGPPQGQFGAGQPGAQYPTGQCPPQGQFGAGQPGAQYPTGQCPPSGNVYPPMQGQQMPSYNQGAPANVPGYGANTQQKAPSYNPPLGPSGTPGNYGAQLNANTTLDCIGSGGEMYRGTMKPSPNFSVEQDCNSLRKAMKGLGTDEKAIIECIGRRNLSQRLEIKKMFKTMFGKDLIDELQSELSSNFCRAVQESLFDADYYDAYSLHKAMEGAGTREDVLTEILTSRSNQQIENIKTLYKKWFNRNLEQEVTSETSGFYKRVLVSCLQANKKELTADEIIRLRQQGPTAVVNTNLARQEAQELFNAGEKKIGTDEACFIKIFATRNKYQLRATFDEYQRLAGRDIITSIEREMSGDLASSLRAMAMQAVNPASFFATRLYGAIKGAGTNDTALIRILLTRSEIDLENIKTEFQKQYGKTLDSFVRGDTSGNYMKFLVRFVEGN